MRRIVAPQTFIMQLSNMQMVWRMVNICICSFNVHFLCIAMDGTEKTSPIINCWENVSSSFVCVYVFVCVFFFKRNCVHQCVDAKLNQKQSNGTKDMWKNRETKIAKECDASNMNMNNAWHRTSESSKLPN